MKKKRCYQRLRIELDRLDPDSPIEEIPPPQEVLLPLLTRNGIKARRVVERGEEVFTGEKIAEHRGAAVSVLHSSISGRFTDIRAHRFIEVGVTPCMVIKSTGIDQLKTDLKPIEKPWEADPEALRRAIIDAGVHLPWAKMQTAAPSTQAEEEVKIVINGIQEGLSSGITRQLLVQFPQKIVDAARILCRLYQVEKITLVADSDDCDWWDSIRELDTSKSLDCHQLKSYFPLGHPGLLCAKLFGINAIDPRECGISVFSVPSIVQIADAVILGRPAIDAYLTVCGPGITTPKHVKVRVGTPLKTLIDFCDGFRDQPTKMALGTPLDGMPQYSMDRPILTDVHWFWLTNEDPKGQSSYRPCINCGDCVDICPVQLMPNMLGKLCEFERFHEAALRYDLKTCIDCGLCGYVCPARRPLVQFINHGKKELLQEVVDHGTE